LSVEDVTRFSGLPVTTGLRTAFDLGRGAFGRGHGAASCDGRGTSDPQRARTEAVIAVDALLNRRVVKLPALTAYLDTRNRWPGTARLREVLTLVEPLTESPMETRLRLILHDAGLPLPIAQHEIDDVQNVDGQRPRRFLARVDFAYPRWRIAIEYEGDHHREPAHFSRDVSRLNALRAAGWLVLRFTADDVLGHPDRIVRLVVGAIHERR
jgi:hypothetical protein